MAKNNITSNKTKSKKGAREQNGGIIAAKKADTHKKPGVYGIGDSTFIYIIATLFLGFSIYSMLATTSYFISWKEDQSIADWSQLLVKDPKEAQNFAGRLGAIIGNMFVGRWFGIFGLCIPVAIFAFSVLLFGIRKAFMRKVFISITMFMLIGSIAASVMTSEMTGTFGSSMGGSYGLFVSEWMQAITGEFGTVIILAMLFVIWIIYTDLSGLKKVFIAVYNLFEKFFGLIGMLFASGAKRTTMVAAGAVGNLAAKMEPEKDLDADDDSMGENLNYEGDVIADIFDEISPIYEISGDEFFEKGSAVEDAEPYDPEQKREGNIEPLLSPLRNMLLPDESGIISKSPVSKMTNIDADVSRLIDADEVVLFGADVFDDESVVISVNNVVTEDEFKLVTKQKKEPNEVGVAKKSADNNGIEFSIHNTIASDDIEEDDDGVSKKSSVKPFEISITDNAQISIDSIPDSENIMLTKNIAEEMVDIDPSVFDPTLELSNYKLPSVDLLENHTKKVTVTEEELYENKNRIIETLENFNITIDKIKATIGPTVTLYEIKPAAGVRISRIKNLEDDIALSLSALGIRIIAPMPGKGTVGIEVPNKNKEVVSMYSVIKSVKFQESDFDLPVVLGRTIQNEDYVIDLARMPHLLVAGATGQGKSVGLNAIITSLLYKKHPSQLKLVLIDPKKVELTLYAHLDKHFLAKMPDEEEAIITDTQKVIYTLNSLCVEMDSRYDLLKKAKVRNIKEYNEKFTSRRLNPNNGHRYLPYFVIIIDEFADLIMTAGKEIETPISRIAQLARAVGMHLVIATQRPTTNIITGVIKANFPARIAFRVSSMIDSRTILDQPGANQLIGRGDMLISTGNDVTRVQCAFVDTPEVERITEFIGNQRGYPEVYELPEYSPESSSSSSGSESGDAFKRDGLFEEVARYVVTNQQGSASTIQRNFSIGFNRAGRLMDQFQKAGIVGKQDGSKPRQVLIQDLASLEVLLYDMDRRVSF